MPGQGRVQRLRTAIGRLLPGMGRGTRAPRPLPSTVEGTIAAASERLARIRDREEALAGERRRVQEAEVEQVRAQVAVLCAHFDELAGTGGGRMRLVSAAPQPVVEDGVTIAARDRKDEHERYLHELFEGRLLGRRFLHLPKHDIRTRRDSMFIEIAMMPVVGVEEPAAMAIAEDGEMLLRMETLALDPADEGRVRASQEFHPGPGGGTVVSAARVVRWTPELLPAERLAATLDRMLRRIEDRQASEERELRLRREATAGRQRRIGAR